MQRLRGFIGLLFLTSVLVASLSSCGPDVPPEVIDNGGDNKGEDTTLVKISGELPPPNFPADNMPKAEAIDLGRHLFYDKILSANNEQACGSCHLQELAFTDGEAVSEGTFGDFGDRSAMPMFNLMWLDNLFWDSRAFSIRDLALKPITNPIEMASKIEDVIAKLNANDMYKSKFKDAYGTDVITDTLLAMALEQFMFSLISDNSRFDQFNRGEIELTASELKGFDALKIKGCFNCHNTALLHDNKSHNTGLDASPKDKGLGAITHDSKDDFKVRTPSLRNIMLTAPYMHDGRFETIEEVIKFYEQDVKFNSRNVDQNLMGIAPRNRLRPDEMTDVIAFLNALTDYDFISNKKHSDPF